MCKMEMSDLLSKYAKSANIPLVILERMEGIWNSYKLVYDVDVTDVFVSEYRNSEDTKVYENAWFFSEKHVMEAKNFIVRSEVDILTIKNGVKYCKLTTEEYDFKKAAEGSRLRADIIFGGESLHQTSAELKATGLNCDCLRDIIKRYFISDMMR